MRTPLAVSLVAVLALLALPAAAEDHEPEPEPERVEDDVILYLHGDEEVGELEDPLGPYRRMDRDAPADGDPKSVFVTNYVGGPNTRCDGNSLLPTWEGFFKGTVTGDVTVVLHTLAGPRANLAVELHADPGIGCVTEPPEPVPTARQIVALEPGLSEHVITFEDLEFDASFGMNLLIHGNTSLAQNPTNQARLFYDNPDFEARIEFLCLAPEGKESC